MASKYQFETRDERIERMHKDNPGRPIELCTAVVDGIWDKRREEILERIPERFASASLEDLGYLIKPIIDSTEAMFSYPGPGTKTPVGIIFSGSAGSGKTHAAYAVLKMLINKNPEMIGYLSSYPYVMQQLRHEFASNTYDEMGSVWDKLNNDSGMYSGILFLDDVSALKPTDFEVDKLMMIIEKRVNEYMPFLLTTNVPQEKFKEVFGERLTSRLLGYCEVIEFEERDKRMENL